MANKTEEEGSTKNFLLNRSMPDCSIIPVLGYTDVVAAIGYLTKTFGFTERWRTGNHRSQLSFGNGAIAITDATSPIPQHLMVRVANVIAHTIMRWSKALRYCSR